MPQASGSEPLGRHHATIRRLRALRREPSRRRAEGVLVAEGLHLAQEALAAAASIELALVSPLLRSHAEGPALERALRARRVVVLETSDEVLTSVQDARSPQPILLVVERPEWPPWPGLDTGADPPLVAVACGIQDPGNLGSLLRCADAAGASACYVCGDSADPFHPRAVRASMGSIFRLPLAVADVRELSTRLRERGVQAVGADPRGDPEHDRADLSGPVALFFGGEGAGLGQESALDLSLRVRIPMREGVESLSVGAAAAVLLFEAARQRSTLRRTPRPGPAG